MRYKVSYKEGRDQIMYDSEYLVEDFKLYFYKQWGTIFHEQSNMSWQMF